MPELVLSHVDALKATLIEPAKDLRLNLGTVLNSETLSADEMWAVLMASVCYLREPRLKEAVFADAHDLGVAESLVQDAQAAAALMGMNTVYYRFRHMVGKPLYSQRPARLRMQWMASPKTSKVTFELACLAVAALAGCEACIKAHEASVLKEGHSEDHVHDAVRMAAVLQGVAVALAC